MATKKEYPLSIVIRTVDKATAGIRAVNARISKMAKKVEAVGKTMTTHITAPIVGVGAASAVAFSRFEKGMSSVSTLVDTNTENIDAMGKEVLAMGARVGVPLEQLTGGLYDVRSAGTDAGDAMRVLEKSAMLGVAGLGSTQEAVDLATSSINAFGLTGEKADLVYDQIFKTVKNGKTTISGLSQGFGAVAGTVAATGTELDEYLAAVAALTTTGLPAAQAHNQIRAAISGLTRVTTDSRKVFRKLGAKDFKDLIAKSGGLVPALTRIKDQLKGNEGEMLKLFGSTEALNAVLGLTGAQSATFANTLSDMREGANAVDEAFKKQNRTMTARWQRTKNALLSAGVAIGEVLAPALEKVAGQLQAAAAWFNGLSDSSKKAIVTFAAITAAIGPVVTVVGKYGKAVGALGKAFAWAKKSETLVKGLGLVGKALTLLGSVFKAVGAAILANPIVLAIAAVAGAALLIWKFWKPIKKFFVDLWDGMPAPIKEFFLWVKLLFMNFTPVGLLIKHWSAIGRFFRQLWERAREPFFTFLRWVKTVFLKFTPLGLIIKHWEPIKQFFSSLWDGIKSIFESAWEWVKKVVDKVTWAVDKVTQASKAAREFLEGPEPMQLKLDLDRLDSSRPKRIMPRESPLGGIVGAREQGQSGETRVMVEFANAPKGTRVAQESRGASVELAVGYQMGGL